MRESIRLKNEFFYQAKDKIRLSRKANVSWADIVNTINEDSTKDELQMLKRKWMLQAVAEVAKEERIREIAIGVDTKPKVSLPQALLNMINKL